MFIDNCCLSICVMEKHVNGSYNLINKDIHCNVNQA